MNEGVEHEDQVILWTTHQFIEDPALLEMVKMACKIGNKLGLDGKNIDEVFWEMPDPKYHLDVKYRLFARVKKTPRKKPF